MKLTELLSNASTRDSVLVAAPELGEKLEIRLRKNTVGDQSRLYDILASRRGKDGNIKMTDFKMAKLICSMVDDQGDYIAEPEELDSLIVKMDADLFERLVEANDKLNPPIDAAAVKEKKSKS